MGTLSLLSRHRHMTSTLRVFLAAGVLAAASLAPAAAHAQATPAAPAAADSIAFPRQFVKWIFDSQGDSAYAHAGTQLRTSMQSAEQLSGMAARLASRFGELQGTDAEVQFDEGKLKVYIAVLRFATAPELGAWVVVYSPETKIVERSSFGPLSNVKHRHPGAGLP